MVSKVLNLIAYVHILVPHLERRLNQVCSGYSWPTYFSTVQSEIDDEFSRSYLLEKSNKYLGFDLLDIDYDRIYEIDMTDTSMFSEKSVNSNPIKVKSLKEVTDYFIELGVYGKIHDISFVEPETFFTFNDKESDLLEMPFRTHGADPWVNTSIKEYYEKYICKRTWKRNDHTNGTWEKEDKLPQIERDLKLRSILG